MKKSPIKTIIAISVFAASILLSSCSSSIKSESNPTLAMLSVTGVSTFQSAVGISSDLTLSSTDTGSSAGPIVNLYRNSSSPADADYLGQIKFQGESDTGVQRNYAKITGKILDASNGTEDGILEFAFLKAGSNNISGRFRSDSLQLLNGTNFSVAGTSDFTGDATFTNDINANGNIVGDTVTNITGIAGVTALTLSGTLQTAAQPNITSLGTLTSLISSGTITATDFNSTSDTLSLSRSFLFYLDKYLCEISIRRRVCSLSRYFLLLHLNP